MSKIIFIAFIFLGNLLFAQSNNSLNVFVANIEGQEGVFVRWIGKDIRYSEGANVYRKSDMGSWELVNKQMIFPPNEISSSFSELKQGLFSSFVSMTKEEFDNDFSPIITLIESVKDYKYALALGLAFHDKTAITGESYQYKVEAKEDGNAYVGESKLILVDRSNVRPDTPKKIELTRKKRRTLFKWEVEENEHYAFDLFMRKEGEPEWRHVQKEISSANLDKDAGYLFDVSTHVDSVYEFKLRTMDYFGRYSEDVMIILPVTDIEPPVFSDVKVVGKTSEMQNYISWSSPSEDIKEINIYRAFESDVDSLYEIINSTPLSGSEGVYEDKLFEAGIFYYKVQAIDHSGNSEISEVESAQIMDVIPPAAPINLTAVADTGIIRLSWDANTEKDLAGYNIVYGLPSEDNSGITYTSLYSGLDTNYYEVVMSKNVRNKFSYAVIALDSSFNASLPSNSVTASLPDVKPPRSPFIKETFEDDGRLAVQWMPNVEPDLKGYNLFRRRKGDAEFAQVNIMLIPGSVDRYYDVELERGIFYEYKLQAIDHSDLTSDFSNISLGKLNFKELSGEVTIVKQKYIKSKKEFLVEWKEDSLINEPIVGFAVYKSKNEALPIPITKVERELSFKEKIEEPGKYTYHIRAYGDRGGVVRSEKIDVIIE